MSSPATAGTQADHTPSVRVHTPSVEERQLALLDQRDAALARFREMLPGQTIEAVIAGEVPAAQRVLSALAEYVGTSQEAGHCEGRAERAGETNERRGQAMWRAEALHRRARARQRLHFELGASEGMVLAMRLEGLADRSAKSAYMAAYVGADAGVAYTDRSPEVARRMAEVAGEAA